MSTNPPSFAPDPERRRPSIGGAHKAVSSQDTGPATGGLIPKVKDADPAQSTSPAPASNFPSQVRITPTVPAAQQWHVGDDDPDARPFNPTTRDQPNDVPPSFMPSLRRGHAMRVNRDSNPDQMPPAYAPSRGKHIPSSYEPGTGEPVGNSQQVRASSTRPIGAPAVSEQRQVVRNECTARRTTSVTSPSPRPAKMRRRRSIWLPIRRTIAVAVILVAAWGSFLLWDANSNLTRTTALSGAADTPGTTYLLAGSDSRADGAVHDDMTEGERSDSIMLVNVSDNGQTVALSIPRDTYAEIPGYGWDKINASFSYGGAPLLIQAVEKLTGLSVDHYVQIGMGGVSNIVDAVDGVELCYDSDVSDELSGLVWQAGCHTVDGTTALAFSRMRYSDPEGDIGRAKRQRQVISKTVSTALSPATLLNPGRTLSVERAGSKAFTVDDDSSIIDVVKLVFAFRSATNDKLMGMPPIESINYTTATGASAVLLEGTTAPDFFARLRAGELTEADFMVE